MYLTQEEQKILNGESGAYKQKLMKLLVDWGDAMQAKRMVRVTNIQPILTMPGRNLAEDQAAFDAYMKDIDNQCAQCPAAKSTSHTNLCNIELPDIDPIIPKCTNEMMELARPSGPILTFTCTPYLVSNVPTFGERCCWTESHAVVLINSMFGARTTRHGAQSSIAAMVLGIVPEFGTMTDEGRKGTLVIDVQTPIQDPMEWGALGYFAGKKAGIGIPVLTGLSTPSIEDAQQISSAMASSGGCPMFHIVGATPEAHTLDMALGGRECKDVYTFTENDLKATIDSLREFHEADIDFVYVGCPHPTLYKMSQISKMLEGKHIHEGVLFEVYTSYGIREYARRLGYVDVIERAGGKVYVDTCPCNQDYLNGRTMMTDSVKQAHYARGTLNSRAALADTATCIKAAIEGKWRA